jgi:hypothetical protein
MLFPFLTSQWISAEGNGGYPMAVCQAALDGAVIVNSLHDLYSRAYGREPTFVEAHHISVVYGATLVVISAHWRENDGTHLPKHYMRFIAAFTTFTESEMSTARTIIKNNLDYALHERLVSLKRALNSVAGEPDPAGADLPNVDATSSCGEEDQALTPYSGFC